MKKLLLISILFLSLFSFGQTKSSNLQFIKNKGQWNETVQYKLNTVGGRIFFHNNSLTYDFYSIKDLNEMSGHNHSDNSEHHEEHAKEKDGVIHCFNYKVNFLNSNAIKFEGRNIKPGYHNYILGNDSKKWASFVPLYKNIIGNNIYNNIDIKGYSQEKNFKYDFIVHPGGNVNDILMHYKGAKSIKLTENKLIINIGFEKITEHKPFVYQIINRNKVEIKSKYILNGNTVSFEIGDYDKTLDLIIDPVVVASTYSGSTETIYGHTATFDDNGNIYSAGAGYAPGGLPVTTGAYQTTYGGSRDMCINKYNPTGSTLIYATYLGGSNSDFPHSLIDYKGKLYILGSSASSNFPVSSGTYDATFNGGLSDIVITILNSTGSSLIGSTYIGGSSDDGRNDISSNYGDTYRGEIMVDTSGNCYVASFTESTNFPTSSGAFQTSLGGNQDGVAFKLNPTLSSLTYSTYIGGTQDDACYGIKIDGNKTFVTGSAGSGFLTATGGAFPTYQGGSNDGFVLSLNATASSIVNATYFGSSQDDQSFFVEIDANKDIYILGQTDGTISATSGVYNGGNGTFITKFNNNLTTRHYTSTTNDLAPVAFLVDDCDHIYVSGHGGLNSLTGFGLTPDAFQTVPAGFYLMVLNPGAVSLNFGSYYGSTSSHVDGGTSRYDKKGAMYQATCTYSSFPTLPGAYSPTNLCSSYDVTVFKVEFGLLNSLPNFGPFPENDNAVFNANGCYDFMAYNSNPGDTFFIDVISNATQFGATIGLPTPNTNGKYNFTYTDTNTGSLKYETDVIVKKINSKRFRGVGKVGFRFCWEPTDCEALMIDTFKIKILGYSFNCNGNVDTITRTVNLVMDEKKYNHLVPNVFSPNKDKKNDFFRLKKGQYDRCYDNLTVRIYNRWGQLMFESDDPEFAWNGRTEDGSEASEGTYYVVLQGHYGKREVTDNFPITLFR